MDHLAVMDSRTIKMIVEGKKQMESRFSKHKIAPFQTIHEGDKVYLKASGGPIKAMFIAGPITHFDELSPLRIQEIKDTHNHKINANDAFWNLKANSRYGTLIEVRKPLPVSPFRITKLGRQAFVSYKDDLSEHTKK